MGRRDRFAAFHARQSLALLLFLVLVTAGWYVIFWLTSFVPYLAIAGLSLFGLVIAAYAFALYAWIRGMSNALNAHDRPAHRGEAGPAAAARVRDCHGNGCRRTFDSHRISG